MKSVKLFYIICSVLMLSSCLIDLFNHKLSVVNKSSKKLSILCSNHTQEDENNVIFYIENYVKPDSTYRIVTHGNDNFWHEYIAKGPAKRLYIYAFEIDTLKKYNGVLSMNDMIHEKRYWQLLTFSESDLNKIDWKVVIK